MDGLLHLNQKYRIYSEVAERLLWHRFTPKSPVKKNQNCHICLFKDVSTVKMETRVAFITADVTNKMILTSISVLTPMLLKPNKEISLVRMRNGC